MPTQVIHPRPPKHWNLPYVMNLADIQHEHFPEFFSPEELLKRRRRFRESAQAAAAICVADEWTRRDILAHIPVSPDKVHAIPLAPTWNLEEAPNVTAAAECATAFGLPQAFAFYPAQTWAHKNHARLLEALAALKAVGVTVPLACCGHQNEHFSEIRRCASGLGLEDQVHWLGLRSEAEVRALYMASRLVVVPTLFEGGPGIPVLEAMAFQKPLAASRVCGIPEAVGEDALLFDPLDPADMAAAIRKLWQDEAFALELAVRAKVRISHRTWAKTSAAYLALYEDVLDRLSGNR
ncbi:MAG TPA: glycosyltransferase family 1 protein [Geothrix sp.]|nr:glycosyltransferase family 1 protein [Geothrix sp.]